MAAGTEPHLVHQDETRCRVLGVDRDGWTHVYDPERERVVVVSGIGIDEQFGISELDKDLGDWMRFVDEKRGWWKEQWKGYRLAEVFSGP